MILELATLLFFTFISFLVAVIILVYLTTSLSITWIDPTPSPPVEQVERPSSPHFHDSPVPWAPNDQGWTLNPDDFITPAPTSSPPPPYVPTTIMTLEWVIDDHTPGSDWDYCPAWGALADFPFQEEEPPF
ncbi:hypothetical protein OG21DRAFT_1490179 [Imleria badia]|nr:hypothetical protein OG21DRAFT_1490179 [Imleria badia]